MRFLIITHVLHKPEKNLWFAYAPYVREMNLWLKYVDEVEIVAPTTKKSITPIEIPYKHDNLVFNEIPAIAFVTLGRGLLSLLSLPVIISKLFFACKRADHIHLRCPGNIGLLGCFVQILFPKKIKTAKYAGNWDPESKQPLSYQIQKKILSSTVFTKRIKVIVYGNWKHQSKNIKSFFTATFSKKDIIKPMLRNYSSSLKFVYIGSLVPGKRPLLAIQIVEKLMEKGYMATLHMYGEGVLKTKLITYCKANNLNEVVTFHGNIESTIIKDVLKTAHFSILASKSEGWPKAIAEAMFFGVIPIATSVSCIPNMLGKGQRGILISNDVNNAVENLESYLKQESKLIDMSEAATKWSQNYTLEAFEIEIKKLI